MDVEVLQSAGLLRRVRVLRPQEAALVPHGGVRRSTRPEVGRAQVVPESVPAADVWRQAAVRECPKAGLQVLATDAATARAPD